MANTNFKKLYPQNYIVLYGIFAVFLPSNKKEGYRLWYPFYY
uniref:Uncharacterized protein n=1 Tax=Podoviridae sp. ctUSJ1 TaxID=2826558 RepID=A0A8S5NEZ2_9CAUD|nr:MAG TPA: hypothetical protein [Podoviridae sp. ctUSJ1]DAO00513.1 MAG TPA: hypothetical protein [Bacteriophage sp.]